MTSHTHTHTPTLSRQQKTKNDSNANVKLENQIIDVRKSHHQKYEKLRV